MRHPFPRCILPLLISSFHVTPERMEKSSHKFAFVFWAFGLLTWCASLPMQAADFPALVSAEGTIISLNAPAVETDGGDNPSDETLKVVFSGRNVRVFHGNGLTLEVYSVTGAKVASHKIDSSDKTVRLEVPRGCYIVKVGNVARKVSVF